MLPKICSALLVTTTLFVGSVKGQTPDRIAGNPTNGLTPYLDVEKHKMDWSVEIDFVAQTNFPKFTWLKITNRFGSNLQLWLTNGVKLQSTNPSILAATNLPSQTTVSSIVSSVHPSNRRGMQWLLTRPEMSSWATTFNLQSAFGISFTNDVVLQITPLLYKVETNEVTACLVEFPPIKMKLLSNGEVQKLP